MPWSTLQNCATLPHMGGIVSKTLNEREKEVLRLLAVGFDTKGVASELQISTNVVNERLRAARKKTGATSSREAARVLATEEQIDHKKFVHKKIEIAGNNSNLHSLSLPSRLFGSDPKSSSSVQDAQAVYRTASLDWMPKVSLPIRKEGERRNELTKPERIAVIADISAKLVVTIATVCFIAVLIKLFVASNT